MLWYKLKLSIRSLAKNKLNSLINIFGLAIGMAAVILISIFIQYELSYDKFNSKHERIHRLVNQLGMENPKDYSICTRLNHELFKDKIPNLEEITQLYKGWECEIIYEEKRFFEFDLHYVDNNFNLVFDLEFIRGNPSVAFKTPNSIIINKPTATKIFGKLDVVGEQITLNGKDYSVSGVTESLPTNSHYQYDVLAPLEDEFKLNEGTGLEFHTYALIKEGCDTKSTLDLVLSEYQKLLAGFESRGYKTGSYFQPLTDVHLHSKHLNSLRPSGSYDSVLSHLLLAILILSIAIINFVNIMTVQYEGKIKEIGMRKAIGASRGELIKQFIGNSILLTFFAVIIGVILSEIFLPHFKNLVYRELILDYSNNLSLAIGIPLLAIGVGIIAGVYPAFFISRPTTALALKGSGLQLGKKNALTKLLVIFQFTVSIILIASLFILHKQVSYLQKADLGFNPEKVIAITNMNATINQSYYSIKEELLKNPLIQYVSASDHIPGGGASGQAITPIGKEENKDKSFSSYRIQPDYFKTVGIKLTEGKSFKESNSFHEPGILINETGAKFLGAENPVGLNVMYKGKAQEIIGVVKDFNYRSLHSKISPLMFTHRSFGMINDILIRYQGNDLQHVLNETRVTIRKFDSGYVLDYIIIEDFSRNKYRNEEESAQLMSYTSILSLILALLGMYALSLFMVQKRTKEIGIRKVTGASILQISVLLFSSFMKWISIAFLISIPICWYVMQKWLEQFAYRIEITPLPFIFAGLITTTFALIVVGGQTWKAANQNPVESLRSE